MTAILVEENLSVGFIYNDDLYVHKKDLYENEMTDLLKAQSKLFFRDWPSHLPQTVGPNSFC